MTSPRPARAPVVHLVLPPGVDDPRHPSGGNVYDRRIAAGLVGLGWRVVEHPVPGSWPLPTAVDRARLADVLAALDDRSTVLLDGLVGSAADAVAAERERLRCVVVVHMPLAEAYAEPALGDLERRALRAAAGVVTPSGWARDWLLARHGLDRGTLSVVPPGSDPAPVVVGSPGGGRLLCVGVVAPDKGQQVIVAALGRLRQLAWSCRFVGALDLAPAYVERLRAEIERLALGDRVELCGPLTGARLDAVRADTDLVLSASLRESYGMAVAEGLARGLPAIASAVGGHSEALGRADDGTVPGALVPPGRVLALAEALHRWLTEPRARDRWRAAATRRRSTLPGWGAAAEQMDAVLQRVGAGAEPDVARMRR